MHGAMRRFVSLLVVAGGLGAISAAAAEAPKPKVFRACPPDMVWRENGGGCVCASAMRWDEAAKRCTTACPPGKVQVSDAPPGTCAVPARTCPPGRRWSELHDGCVVVCPAGKAANQAGTGCVADAHGCPADTQWFETRRACLPFCAPGRSIDYSNGTCVDDAAPKARPPAAPAPAVAPPPPVEPSAAAPAPPPPPPPRRGPAKPRVPSTPKPCPEGKEWKEAFDGCVPICPDGQVLDFYGIACHPIRTRR